MIQTGSWKDRPTPSGWTGGGPAARDNDPPTTSGPARAAGGLAAPAVLWGRPARPAEDNPPDAVGAPPGLATDVRPRSGRRAHLPARRGPRPQGRPRRCRSHSRVRKRGRVRYGVMRAAPGRRHAGPVQLSVSAAHHPLAPHDSAP
jgi:hypothetical protein